MGEGKCSASAALHLVRGRPRPNSRGGGVGMGYGGAYTGKKVSQSVPNCPKVFHYLPSCAISLFWSRGWTLLPGRELLRSFGINYFSGLELVSDKGSLL